MNNEIKHLRSKIHTFEDMMLRTKNYKEADRIRTEIVKMRLRLRNLEYQK